MQTIRDIIQAHGYTSVDAMGIGDHIEINPEGNSLMPLVIEKIAEHQVAIAHYYTQRGDVMYDPEIVFHINQSGTWMAVEYTQHPHTYQHDENGLIDAQDFAVNTWNDNIRNQGYVEAAQRGDE